MYILYTNVHDDDDDDEPTCRCTFQSNPGKTNVG